MSRTHLLDELVPHYAHAKAEADAYKKIADKDNTEIKEIMLEAGFEKYEAGGYVASCSTTTKETFNEEALIEYLKKNKAIAKGIVKKREYVDMDALENAIYNGVIDAATLKPYQESKDVVTLRIKKA